MFSPGEKTLKFCSEVLSIPIRKLRPASKFSVCSRTEKKDHDLEFAMQE